MWSIARVRASTWLFCSYSYLFNTRSTILSYLISIGCSSENSLLLSVYFFSDSLILYNSLIFFYLINCARPRINPPFCSYLFLSITRSTILSYLISIFLLSNRLQYQTVFVTPCIFSMILILYNSLILYISSIARVRASTRLLIQFSTYHLVTFNRLLLIRIFYSDDVYFNDVNDVFLWWCIFQWCQWCISLILYVSLISYGYASLILYVLFTLYISLIWRTRTFFFILSSIYSIDFLSRPFADTTINNKRVLVLEGVWSSHALPILFPLTRRTRSDSKNSSNKADHPWFMTPINGMRGWWRFCEMPCRTNNQTHLTRNQPEGMRSLEEDEAKISRSLGLIKNPDGKQKQANSLDTATTNRETDGLFFYVPRRTPLWQNQTAGQSSFLHTLANTDPDGSNGSNGNIAHDNFQRDIPKRHQAIWCFSCGFMIFMIRTCYRFSMLSVGCCAGRSSPLGSVGKKGQEHFTHFS